MKREELAHILRAAADIAGDGQIVVVGSQAILASYPEEDLPEEATMSMEADIAFLDDPSLEKGDKVDGAIGEGSGFHQSFGYYAQGVDTDTAILPAGWRDRAIPYRQGDHGSARAICPEAHDLVASKLVAGREKDVEYARALAAAGLIDPDTLRARIELLDIIAGQRRRIRAIVDSLPT